MNPNGKELAVIVGATSKWQADGKNTKFIFGKELDDSAISIGARWGVGGAVAQKFAQEGFFVVLTTRKASNAENLETEIRDQGGECMTVELDLTSRESIEEAFAIIRREAGDPQVLVYNAGYMDGRELPPDKDLLEHVPVEMLDTALHISGRGPFLVAKEVLPAMRENRSGSFLISNNAFSLRGHKRHTGESLYYPRVLMRTLAQVLTEEYSVHGVHVANIIIDGLIDSPGTRSLSRAKERPDDIMNPVKIAEAFFYLHTQDRCCWTHEIQLTPSTTVPKF
ncbi:SDR family oxidoreductase [SAR202 cluster bacterium AD-804-J14_MRT_500m]|nr:SDR family oxidoreductase [SAR202 cluster bacterium AD-804-J14_MRT_500m]